MPLPPRRKRQLSPPGSSDRSTCSNIRVAVRVRPETKMESQASRNAVQVLNENVLVFDPKEQHESSFGPGRRSRRRDIRKRQNKDLKFAFDFVYGPTSKTIEVYEQTTRPILDGLFDGFNCSVFAYGATGSGKTHTMLGSKEQPGVIFQAMVDLYRRIDDIKDNTTCDVAISYLEVYNEGIRDLLMPGSRGTLPVREDSHNGVVIPGLSLHKPQNAEELLYMLQFGNEHRTQHPTDANSESSRSHAVFQVFLRQKDRTANISAEVKVAKLCLVDLAGSERAIVTKNNGSRLREGANINRSLLALGNVINALAENKSKGFIPYRDSKLTRLLKDSLGGNCQTVMIAAISPSMLSYEESLNTLRYADRAKNIKLDLKKNVLNVDFHVAKYGQIVEELRREIIELKGKLSGFGSQVPSSCAIPSESHIRWLGEIEGVHGSDLAVRCEQLRREIELRQTQWKIYRRQRCLSRLAVLSEPSGKPDVEKVEGIVRGLQQRAACMKISTDNGRGQVEESGRLVHTLQQQLAADTASSDNQLPQVISLSLQVRAMKAELEGARQQVGYIKKAVRHQERELQHNERLILQLLKLIRWQHYIIKGHNFITSDLQDEYTSIQKRAAGLEVCWEDQSTGTGLTRGYTLAELLDLPSLSVDTSSSLSAGAETSSQPSVPVKPLATVTKTPKPATGIPTPNKGYSSVPLGADGMPPSKARRMLPSSVPPGRVDNHGQTHSQRQPVTGSNKRPVNRNLTNTNYSRAPIFTEVSAIKSANFSTTNRNNSRTCSKNNCTCSITGSCDSLENSGNTQLDVSSSDSEELSKFSKVNDTITKCKKYSIMHGSGGAVSCKPKALHNLNETFELQIPKIAEITTAVSTTTGINTNEKSRNCINSNFQSYSQTVSLPLCPESVSKVHSNPSDSSDHNSPECTCSTGSSQNSNLNSTFDMDEKYPQTHCEKCAKNRLQTGSVKSPQENDQGDPNNVSDSSTIVNRSSGSLNSTHSTLCDAALLKIGANLSLSSFNDAASNILSGSSTLRREKSVTALHPVNAPLQTHTKCGSSSESGTQLHSTTRHEDHSIVKVTELTKASDENATGSSQKGRTYADVVQTPSPVRKPLNPVMENTSVDDNTHLSSSSEGYYGSSLCQVYVHPAKTSRLSDPETKENDCRIMSKFGLPSLTSSSLLNKNKGKLTRNESFTPGYMQSTKATFHRLQHTAASRNASLGNSGERSDVSSINGLKSAQNIANSNPRTLLSNTRNRSKSAGNISARAAWQN